MKKGGTMKNVRNLISLILVIVLMMSAGTAVFADNTSLEPKNEKTSISSELNLVRGTYNDCLWRGGAVLSNPSSRNFVLEGEVSAYHVVDELGFTLYLQRKATTNGVISTVGTFSYDDEDKSYTYHIFNKTVNKSGYYRISAKFTTKHSLHQTESSTTTTSWIWVD